MDIGLISFVACTNNAAVNIAVHVYSHLFGYMVDSGIVGSQAMCK